VKKLEGWKVIVSVEAILGLQARFLTQKNTELRTMNRNYGNKDFYHLQLTIYHLLTDYA